MSTKPVPSPQQAAEKAKKTGAPLDVTGMAPPQKDKAIGIFKTLCRAISGDKKPS